MSPVQFSKVFHSPEGIAVNLIELPELYSVVFLLD